MDIFDVGGLTARRTMVAAAAILLAYTLINPVGFLGGGMDDWHYLNAARCWVAHGPCLPYDHWQARWPLVGAMAMAMRLFGENRFSVGLPSLLATIACVPPLAMIGNRLFAPPVGFGAMLIFLLVPSVAVELTDPNVEIIEFALLAWGFLALITARDNPQIRWPIVAGLLFALAFQTRETAIVPIVAAGVWALRAIPRERRWRVAALGAAAFAVPLLVEFAAFVRLTGDPLYRRTLAMHHVLVPSTQLKGPIDDHSPPFFNPNFIANWRHEPGVHVHWAVDGLVNFLANSRAGIAQWAAPLLLLLFGGQVERTERRGAWIAIAVGLAIAAGFIYALAIDPKPRMLYAPIALCSMALAVALIALERAGKVLIARTIAAVLVGNALFGVAGMQEVRGAEPVAAGWISRLPGRIAIDPTTRRHLALVPSAERLPDPGGAENLLLIKLDMRCERWLDLTGLDRAGWTVAARSPLNVVPLLSLQLGRELCLFDAHRSIDARTFERAHDRVGIAQMKRGVVAL